MSKKLPYLKSFRDRHGKARHYFRKPGCETVALPGEYGSKEFIAAYWEARESAPKRELGADRTVPGSLSALVGLYYGTTAYRELKPITRATYRNTAEKIREKHGELLVKGIRQRHIATMLDGLSANKDNWRKVIRLLLNLALERGWINTHPMAGMRRPRKAKAGYRAWTEEDIAAFEVKWPSGSRERLALALLLYTAQRRSDVVTMGRQHVKAGKIHVAQSKGDGMTKLWIPLHAALAAEIAQAPKDQLSFIQTQYGQPFTAAGFGNWFSEKAKEAGLPEHSSPHGLRKAAARRLAEAGCTPHQIMAVTGHANLSEVTLYTASVDQERLAGEAIARTKVSTLRRPVRQSSGNVVE